MISDHFHPWIDRQGTARSSGACSARSRNATERSALGTGVTCPLIRTHPAIIAQAAATSGHADAGPLLPRPRHRREPERARHWAPAGRRPTSGSRCWRRRSRSSACSGRAASRPTAASTTPSITRASTRCPTSRSPIAVAAAKPNAAELAGRLGDALRHDRARKRELVETYRVGRRRRPALRPGEASAGPRTSRRRGTLVHELWPTSALGGTQNQELPRPSDFEAAVENLTRGATTTEGDAVRARSGARARADRASGSRPASTTSPCTRSAPTRTASSASGARSCSPALELTPAVRPRGRL